jgi:hypothetical protein
MALNTKSVLFCVGADKNNFFTSLYCILLLANLLELALIFLNPLETVFCAVLKPLESYKRVF